MLSLLPVATFNNTPKILPANVNNKNTRSIQFSKAFPSQGNEAPFWPITIEFTLASVAILVAQSL
jgi:hypothetical protein